METAEQIHERDPLIASEIAGFVAQYDPQSKIGTMAQLLASNFGDLVSLDDICAVWGENSRNNRGLVSSSIMAMQRTHLGEQIRAYRLLTFGDVMLAPTMLEGDRYTPPARKALIPPDASQRVSDFLTDMLSIQIASRTEAHSFLTPKEMSILLDLVAGTPVTNQGLTWLIRDKLLIAGYDDVLIRRKFKHPKREAEGYYYFAGSIFQSQ